MPGPPPPPPPCAPPPPMMGGFAPPKGPNPALERGALLKSIQKGTKLKKTVTNDRSTPIVGKPANNPNNAISSNTTSYSQSAAPVSNGLGGLFKDGMPKLKPTGKIGAVNNTNSASSNGGNLASVRQQLEATLGGQSGGNRGANNVQSELKKQLASDNKNRGPPPPAPLRNLTLSNKSNNSLSPPTSRQNSNSPSPTTGFPSANQSTLHRKSKSNIHIDQTDATTNGFTQNVVHKPSVNYGKPNLAPRPPGLNDKPTTPLKKPTLNGKPINRSHSVRSPSSPDVSPQFKFGTVRNMSSKMNITLGSTGNLSPRPRPPLNGRPSAPPPSVPLKEAPPVPPNLSTMPSKGGLMKPPNHAPPPPPGPPLGALPQPPSHAPPLPPHKTLGSSFSTSSQAPPPPPPPRNSSMRETVQTSRKFFLDLEDRFGDKFHSPNTFPRPPPYRNVLKFYSNRQGGNKQPAPQPPAPYTGPRSWDASQTC